MVVFTTERRRGGRGKDSPKRKLGSPKLWIPCKWKQKEKGNVFYYIT